MATVRVSFRTGREDPRECREEAIGRIGGDTRKEYGPECHTDTGLKSSVSCFLTGLPWMSP